MRITRIGQNEVEVIRTRMVDTISSGRGMESQQVEVLDESTKTTYGRSKIEADITNLQAQIDVWSDPRKVEEHIENLRSKLADLREIERVLNG